MTVDPSGLHTVYEPYYPKEHAWSPRLIETTPSGFGSFRQLINEVLQHYHRSLPNSTAMYSSPSSSNVSTTPAKVVSYRPDPRIDQLTQIINEVRVTQAPQTVTQAQQASTQAQQAAQLVSLSTKIDDVFSGVTTMTTDVNNKFDILLAAIQRQPQSFPPGKGASSGND